MDSPIDVLRIREAIVNNDSVFLRELAASGTKHIGSAYIEKPQCVPYIPPEKIIISNCIRNQFGFTGKVTTTLETHRLLFELDLFDKDDAQYFYDFSSVVNNTDVYYSHIRMLTSVISHTSLRDFRHGSTQTSTLLDGFESALWGLSNKNGEDILLYLLINVGIPPTLGCESGVSTRSTLFQAITHFYPRLVRELFMGSAPFYTEDSEKYQGVENPVVVMIKKFVEWRDKPLKDYLQFSTPIVDGDKTILELYHLDAEEKMIEIIKILKSRNYDFKKQTHNFVKVPKLYSTTEKDREEYIKATTDMARKIAYPITIADSCRESGLLHLLRYL